MPEIQGVANNRPYCPDTCRSSVQAATTCWVATSPIVPETRLPVASELAEYPRPKQRHPLGRPRSAARSLLPRSGAAGFRCDAETEVFDNLLFPRLLERQPQIAHQGLGVFACRLKHILRFALDLELHVGFVPDLLKRRCQLFFEGGLFYFVDMNNMHFNNSTVMFGILNFFDCMLDIVLRGCLFDARMRQAVFGLI